MFLWLVLSLANKVFLHFRAGKTKVLYHVSPGKTVEGIFMMYILNLVLALILRAFSGVWLIPELDLLKFLVISVIV
jgi:CDP-diglyceride synthetase